MALLAVVAAAGRKGVSRDRILALLWPDSDAEQGRHTLSQNLYTLRRETGQEWIAATTELRLDPSVSSDIGDFRDALAAGDHAGTASLYSGAFLDGFYLQGVPEFDRWVEEERGRLEGAVRRSLEVLARDAAATGRHREAIAHYHRLTELDPVSARYAGDYMRALAAGGDRPGALDHGRAHEAYIRRELEAGIDPSIQALMRSLRVRSETAEAMPPVELPSRTAAREPEHSVEGSPSPAPREKPTHRTIGWRLAAGVAVLIVMVVVGRVLSDTGPRSPPFLAVGAIRTPGSVDTVGMGSVLRDLLATGLGGIEGLQVVANSRLVELLPVGADTVRGAASDAARRAGATEVIEGEVVPGGSGLVLTLRRVALSTGVVRQGYVVEAANRMALIDSATAAIARDLHLDTPRRAVGDIRTSSPAAYALYEEGLRAYYQYDGAAAYRLMTAAVEKDSGFAMAAYYAWQASRGLIGEPEATAALERARRLAPRTIDRERLLILGSVGALDAPISGAAAIAETLTVRYPADPDGQILLGQVRFAAGDWKESVAAYNRAFVLDSSAGATTGPFCRICIALGSMSSTYLWWDSTAAAERVARRLIAIRPEHPSGWSTLAEPLLRQQRREEAERALERMMSLTTTRFNPAPELQRDLIRNSRLDEVDRELLADLANPSASARVEARWLLLISLRNQGRLRDAAALAAEGRIPGRQSRLNEVLPEAAQLATVKLEAGNFEDAARQFRSQADGALRSNTPPAFQARVGTWLLTLAGTAYAGAGDTLIVRQLADSIARLGPRSSYGRDSRLHQFLRGLVLQREGRHADAVEAFQRALFSTTDGFTRINLMMARSLMSLQRPMDAVKILQPALRGGVDGSNTYVTHTELHEALAQAFEAAGEADSAQAHFRIVERAWRRADPEFRERYGIAKAKAHPDD